MEKSAKEVKDNVTSSAASATGNPRNKVALLPGFSLMDWIRLGNSGKDLTGVGGKLQDVTEEELAKHNQKENAWLVIRGKVYNVAPYLNFHPGGVDELMRGAGKDATALFTEVHSWVNFESILKKCLVGRLVKTTRPANSLDFEEAFFENLVSHKSKSDVARKAEEESNSDIKMTWSQTPTIIKFVFQCINSSPHVLIRSLPNDRIRILIRIKRKLHVFSFRLADRVNWPCRVNVNTDTGRLEAEFRKSRDGLWRGYGTDDEENAIVASSVDEIETYHKARLVKIEQVTHNVRTFIFKFVDKVYMWVPIGHDIRIRAIISDMDYAKQYTPIPPSLDREEHVDEWQSDCICCMVKHYPDGALTPYLFEKETNDTVEIGGMSGNFNIRKLNNIKRLYLIAAGSGLSPMLRLMMWASSKRPQLKSMDLLSVNRYENDIIWRDKLDDFAAKEKWFRVTYCLSQPEPGWTGLRGRLDEEILNNFLPDFAAFPDRQPDFYVCACGPIQFTEMIQEHLNKRGYASCSHCFLG